MARGWWPPKRGKKRGVREEPASPGEMLWGALGEMSENRKKADRRHRRRERGKHTHTDDYRELVLDGTDAGRLSEALLDLTREAHADRGRLLSEERGRTVIRGARRGVGGDEDARREAQRASDEMKANMKRHGMQEPDHYYRAVDRAQTGEVDRTYVVEEKGEEKR